MIDTDFHALRGAAGLGVAGNFAGHLEQAGEADMFANVAVAAPDAPKGIFPWFIPGRAGDLGGYPLSAERILIPSGDMPVDLQIEPEVGALCRATYDGAGRLSRVAPMAVGAFNDCTIRRVGARTISDKKNWGPDSKGFAARLFPVADLNADGGLGPLRIASFLRRDGATHAYGLDSPARGYSYAGETLLAWFVECARTQTGGADTPLEPVGEYLDAASRPELLVIGIGATRYTPFGETTYLAPGDESIVIVYDETASSPGDVADAVASGHEAQLPAASVLVQRVVTTS